MSLSLVISSATRCCGSVAKRTSRLVRMPTSLPGSWSRTRSTTGMPEMRFSFIRSSASCSVAPGSMVSGLTTMPDSNFLTWRTWAACSFGVQIAVDDADAAGLRHGDGHLHLGHRVHGGGDDRDIDGDRAGDVRADIDVGGQHFGQAGPDQHVVESEPFARASVVFCGHRQLRHTRKGERGRLPKADKMPVARGSSRDVTARFWVGGRSLAREWTWRFLRAIRGGLL